MFQVVDNTLQNRDISVSLNPRMTIFWWEGTNLTQEMQIIAYASTPGGNIDSAECNFNIRLIG